MKAFRFVLHLFFEDPKIPVGVMVAMAITALTRVRTIPWASNILYLAIILTVLAWSALTGA